MLTTDIDTRIADRIEARFRTLVDQFGFTIDRGFGSLGRGAFAPEVPEISIEFAATEDQPERRFVAIVDAQSHRDFVSIDWRQKVLGRIEDEVKHYTSESITGVLLSEGSEGALTDDNHFDSAEEINNMVEYFLINAELWIRHHGAALSLKEMP